MTRMQKSPAISLPIFYSLIAAQFILPIIAALVDILSPQPELALLDKTLYIEPQSLELFIITGATILISIISIGLFLRKNWARKAYLYTFFPAFLIYFLPYMHWIYMSSFAAIFNDLAFVAAGILLTILAIPALYQPLFEEKN